MKLIFRASMGTSQRNWLLLLVLVACLAVTVKGSNPNCTLLPNPSGSQQTPITVTSELVAIPVLVTNARGNFVPGLTRDNFQIYEDDRVKEITLFEQEDTPVSVGIVVDHSTSMASKLSNVAKAISDFAASSNVNDEMFVVDFANEVAVEPPSGKMFANNAADL